MTSRANSIKHIGSVYEQMLISRTPNNSEVVEEKAKPSMKVKAKDPKGSFPKSEEKVKEPKSIKKSGPGNVKGLQKPSKNKKYSQNSGKVVEDSINSFMNVFDKLFEDVMKDEDISFDSGIGSGPEGDMNDEVDTAPEANESNEVTITLDKDLAEKLHDVLMTALGGEKSEEESDLEDLGIEDKEESEDEDCEGWKMGKDEDAEEKEEDEEDELNDAVEMQKVAETGAKHLQGKDNKVGGALKSPSKGKASAEVTDEVSSKTLGDKGSHLTKPGNNKVGNYKQGASLFGN